MGAEGEAEEAGGVAGDVRENLLCPIDLCTDRHGIGLAQVGMSPGVVAELEARLAGEELYFGWLCSQRPPLKKVAAACFS